MPFPTFDRSQLRLKRLSERTCDLDLKNWLALDELTDAFDHENLPTLAERIVAARKRGAAVILLIGAHVLRAGVSRHIIDLLERGVITHVAMNGGASIHDFELALIGATTESVARYIREGQFGLWNETGLMNDAIIEGAHDGIGMGEALGRSIELGSYQYRSLSVLAAGYRLQVPVTVHIGIGYDIIHEHPNCEGASLGTTSYHDFLIIAHSISGLEGGVVLSFGSAVMAPEVFLKGLAMARNVANQEGREIRHFVTAVFDLVRLEGDLRHEAARGTPEYYFRPFKTLLVRTVADGGESFYFCGNHRATFPALYRLILERL
jgi:hypothetical protein